VIRKSDNRSKDCNLDHPSSDCAVIASVRPAESLLRTDRPDLRTSTSTSVSDPDRPDPWTSYIPDRPDQRTSYVPDKPDFLTLGSDPDRPDPRASSVPPGSATTQDPAAVPGIGTRRNVSSLTTGIIMIIGIVASIIIVLLLLALAVHKYRSRDEGTYRVDESKNYGYDACNSKPLVHLDGRSRSTSSSAQSLRQKRKESHREWYV